MSSSKDDIGSNQGSTTNIQIMFYSTNESFVQDSAHMRPFTKLSPFVINVGMRDAYTYSVSIMLSTLRFVSISCWVRIGWFISDYWQFGILISVVLSRVLWIRIGRVIGWLFWILNRNNRINYSRTFRNSRINFFNRIFRVAQQGLDQYCFLF